MWYLGFFADVERSIPDVVFVCFSSSDFEGLIPDMVFVLLCIC